LEGHAPDRRFPVTSAAVRAILAVATRDAVAPSTAPASRSRRRRASALWQLVRRIDGEALSQAAPWLGLFVGSFLVTASYAWAASHATGTSQFTLFWAGQIAFIVPCAYRLGREGARRHERILLVVAMALFFFLPKVLRNPSGPIYADELAHWRQAEVLHTTGHLFEPNPFITVASGYPGLHALTEALRIFSGLSTWGVGVMLVALCLCLNVLGVFHLSELLLGDRTPRAPGFAALIYACSSGFMFFDSQYAYETLGLPLLIWVLVALAHLLHEEATSREQRGWLVIACTLCLGLVVTHHLTSIVLCVVLGVASLVAIVQRRRQGWVDPAQFRYTLGFTVFAIAATALWAVLVAPDLIDYLSPHLTGGISQLSGILQHQQGSRQLFTLSTSPAYEHRAAFVAPAIAAVLVLGGLLTLMVARRGGLSPLLTAVLVLGVAYFPSVPFILTTSGAEGARRSWNFSYIGVALLAGLACDTLLAAGTRERLRGFRRALLVRVVPLALPLALALILVGNVSAGLNVEYRFPGPYVFGSDTRSLTAETRGAVGWFDATQGDGQRIIADRQDGIAFGSLGRNWIERAYDGLPLWQFYFQAQRPDRGVFSDLQSRQTGYMVVDDRISRYLPRTGVYMVGDEPGAHQHVSPPPAAAVKKYDVTPWTNRIYSSNHLQVLRLDIAALGACTDQAPEPGTSFARCPGTRARP
jgi:hypothetical protein